LKILSRITEPTSGRAIINGRVSSLLEVGTGFHPELTGRENIYLNGTILGMSKREIDNKFDEIVAFSEIGKFLDTPVKRYSSGMGVRLAFAVAAHLEPEILLVDEVLAVGDTAFQKKCLGKMEDVSKEGKTILFVSHNLATLSALCSRVILLENGKKIMDDIANKTIERYLASMSESTKTPLSTRTDREGTGRMRFTDAWVEDDKGNRVEVVCSGQDISIVAAYETEDKTPLRNPYIGFAVRDSSGNYITDLVNENSGYNLGELSGNGKIKCQLARLPLNAGTYFFSVCCIMNGLTADWVIDAGKFTVESGDFFGTGKLPKKALGSFLFNQKWDGN
jgi:lipopolysaccharide transport system ATP-binding protein